MRPFGKIIIRPLVTEKNAVLKEKLNKVSFEIARDANRIEVKKAVEGAFKVKVSSVNILTVRGKVKRTGRHLGRRRDWKKAVVTLMEGSNIEFFEGV